MRVPPLLLPVLALSCAFTLAACAGADDPPRVPTELRCDTGAGQTQRCTLELTVPAGFTITLTGSECDAINDTIELTSPTQTVLTDDACREPIGRVWDFSTPINPAGTQIDIVFTSDQYANTPGTRVQGPVGGPWVVNFEDGGDTDYNDVVLTVNAVPET